MFVSTLLNLKATFRIDKLLLVLIVLWLSGCVSIPAEEVSKTITSAELRNHVEFLAQPSLKGRRPGSTGSKLARQYINEKFSALNLVPWGQAKSFNQKFFSGTNVIGILPGSDPNLADEYVILAAHYDHVGKTADGLCLGACDNASGVAALLEIAEELSLRETKPRRSICFAALDCEETFTLGAFSFTCRDDFDSSQIAGVINVDMLGRAGFEVLEEHLFLVGSGNYLSLREQIQQSVSNSIQILPVGTDVVGPRGDHVAFENMDFPVLFFTCSLYKDYHLPSDTADKLNYEMISKSSQIIQNAVEILANADKKFVPVILDSPDIEELEAVNLVLSKILEDPNAIELKEDTVKSLQFCKDMADEYLADKQSYTLEDRNILGYWIADAVLDYEGNRSTIVNTELNSSDIYFRRMQVFLLMQHRNDFVEKTRKIIKRLSNNNSSLLANRTVFFYNLRDLSDSHIALTELEDGQYRLVYFVSGGIISIETPVISGYLRRSLFAIKTLFGWLLPGQNSNAIALKVIIGINSQWPDITGTREEIIDIMLLFRKAQGSWGEPENKVLRLLTQHDDPETYEQWVEWRCEQGGWENEEQWILSCRQSDNLHLVYFALLPEFDEPNRAFMIFKYLLDRNSPSWIRLRLINSLNFKTKKEMLLVLAELIDDDNVAKERDVPLPDDHPLKPLAVFCRPLDIDEAEGKQNPDTDRTFSDIALERLKLLTKEDFGKDKIAWIKWINENAK